ncbi:MAG: Omp28-related outer membrane protein, partial [Saprospiraceae bacterium]|nr:Omp28-related outer membrane protein [Saprospiraceae bacterium]
MQRTRCYISLLLLSLCWVLSSPDALAQSAPKYPLLEHFTNTPCVICASQNPGFFNRLEAYAGQYHHVSFWPGTPYTSCIFYQANIPENTARKNYYLQVVGSPDVAINGVDFKSPSSVTNAVLDGLVGGTSWLSITVQETSGSTRDVTIDLQDHAGGSLSSGLLFAVVVEKEVMYNAPNGETLHHNVFREFLTSTGGDAVDLSSGSASLSYQYTLDGGWQADEIYVVAWLTAVGSKEVINSGTRFDEVVSGTRDIRGALPLRIYPNPASDYV